MITTEIHPFVSLLSKNNINTVFNEYEIKTISEIESNCGIH